MQRDPRLCLCVDEEAAPYAFVQVQGEATISEEPAELVRSAPAIAARYTNLQVTGRIAVRARHGGWDMRKRIVGVGVLLRW